jgi:23S rRNA (uridine2552-2'-O)-methyltransferase
MGKRWQGDRKKDFYYRLAKSREYRSRASFKLGQINKKFKLFQRGDSVLDLGAAPGGWMQMAGEIVGAKGVVVGVDLDDIEPFEEKNIVSIKGDILKKETMEIAKNYAEFFDAVISDASPDISGVWDVDHFNSIDIARNALRIALDVLPEGGNFLVKVFQGSLVKEFTEEVKREFAFTKVAKPFASRQQSSEVYIVARGRLKTPVKSGDILELRVRELGERGDGVAFLDGFKVFVKEGKVNEKTLVKIKKVHRNAAWGVKV